MCQPHFISFLVSLCLLQFTRASPLVEKRVGLSTFITDNYNFVGCFLSTTGLPLTGLNTIVIIASNTILDHDKCATACSTSQFFGIFRGHSCICGNVISPAASDATGQCTSQCPGLGSSTPAESCGGPFPEVGVLTSIFEKKVPTDPLPLPPYVTPSYQIGCFEAPAPVVQFTMRGLGSADRCQVICRGSKFYSPYGSASANSKTCSCYDTIITTPGDQSSCYLRCGEDGNQPCGGVGYRSIYSAQPGCSNADLQVVKNPSFESGVAYWSTLRESNQITWSSRAYSSPVQGTKVASFYSKAPALSITLVQPIKLCAGIQYELSFSSKQDSDAECYITPAITQIPDQGEFNTELNWKTSTVQFYPQVESSELSLTIRCDGAGTGSFRKMYLDNIILARVKSSGGVPS